MVQDKYGFIYSEDCDSLLFTGLVGCVPGVAVHIDAARSAKTDMWQRRPCDKPCYPAHSKSSISRDMLLGLLYFAYFNKRLDIIEHVIKYALSNYLIMGQGVLSRTLMTPGLLATYAWASYRLGGPSRPWLRWVPVSPSAKVDDFQAHLAVLHALLRDILTGKLTQAHNKLYEVKAKAQPENALFQYAAGNIDKVYTILNNEQYFPSDRLPNRSDRKSPWLWERDFGPNYQPTSENKIYSGGDYLFVYWLLNRQS